MISVYDSKKLTFIYGKEKNIFARKCVIFAIDNIQQEEEYH